MNKIHLYKIAVILLLTAMMFTFNNCLPKVPGQGGNSERSPSSYEGPEAPKTDEEVLNAIQVTTGVKNFEQILHTMSEVTGISSQNTKVKGVFAAIATSLPNENDAKTFMASHQVAVTKLAAEFCNELVSDTNVDKRSKIWPNFNFALRPNQTPFTNDMRLYIIDKAIEAFWVIASDAEMDMAEQQLIPMFDDLLMNESATSANTTKAVVKGVCTAILSSAQVTLL